MGKKSKNSTRTHDSQLPLTNEGKLELEVDDFNLETANSINSVKKSKKKRNRDISGTTIEDTPKQVNSELSKIPTDDEATHRKKKKHSKTTDQAQSEAVQNDSVKNDLNEDQLDVPKKKKKKSQTLGEDVKLEIDQGLETDGHKTHNDSKKKKNISSINEVKNVKDIEPKTENNAIKQKKKKGKKKTGAPVLNNEESQVTEEDIDKFIDELDEEDNKQYEDWVKLLDARLSKKIKTE